MFPAITSINVSVFDAGQGNELASTKVAVAVSNLQRLDILCL